MDGSKTQLAEHSRRSTASGCAAGGCIAGGAHLAERSQGLELAADSSRHPGVPSGAGGAQSAERSRRMWSRWSAAGGAQMAMRSLWQKAQESIAGGGGQPAAKHSRQSRQPRMKPAGGQSWRPRRASVRRPKKTAAEEWSWRPKKQPGPEAGPSTSLERSQEAEPAAGSGLQPAAEREVGPRVACSQWLRERLG